MVKFDFYLFLLILSRLTTGRFPKRDLLISSHGTDTFLHVLIGVPDDLTWLGLSVGDDATDIRQTTS